MVPKTTSNFDDLQEDPQDSVCSHTRGSGLLQQRDVNHSPQRAKAHGVKSRETRGKLPRVLSPRHHTGGAYFPQHQVVTAM